MAEAVKTKTPLVVDDQAPPSFISNNHCVNFSPKIQDT